ncbi:hypothetical protein N9L49_04005 [Rhodospirillales bacterium]|jgi:hypothetical protein|nr:hypothetical protein [Rhodospirillales bacterium]
MADPELHDDLEGHAANESDRYGILPGIAGVLIGVCVIAFMFAVADGFH